MDAINAERRKKEQELLPGPWISAPQSETRFEPHWIKHDGGPQPVADGTLVAFTFYNVPYRSKEEQTCYFHIDRAENVNLWDRETHDLTVQYFLILPSLPVESA